MADQPKKFTDQIQALIEPLRGENPALHQALEYLNNGLETLDKQINPDAKRVSLPGVSQGGVMIPPFGFRYTLPGRVLKLEWDSVVGVAQYEVRRGTDWNTALFQVKTSSLIATLEPIPTGSYTYLLKSVSLGGVYTIDATQLVVSIGAVGAVSIGAQVIDNNILLRWTEPTSSFDIDYYELFKDGVSIGYNDGNFAVIFESTAGNYNYGIIATDMAGNDSPMSTILTTVNQPPDFEIFNTYLSPLNGTLVNAYKELTAPARLLAPVDMAQSWTAHFSSHSWTTIQDQINAGYLIYAQPTVATGSYEEIIDYGVIINNIIANITYNFAYNDPAHQINIVVKLAGSTNGTTYSSLVAGAVQFFGSIRYLKLRLEFSSTPFDDKALVSLYNLIVKLDVKRDLDSGTINALATDVGGTQVLFNKVFKDIDSITLSTQSVTQPITAIYDFVDTPNPIGFKVYTFDSTGNRVSYLVTWKARGII